MDAARASELGMAMVDWVAIGLCLAGLLLGMRAGLGRSFALLLWLLAALWLGANLSAKIVGWLPNTATPEDPQAQRIAYVVVVGVVLLVPVLGRLLGGAAGKKKKDKGPPTHKPSGALVGLFNVVLLLTLLLPFLAKVELIGQDFAQGRAPRWASGFADQMAYLYPQVHRDALREAVGAPFPPAAPATLEAPAAK
jgi:uncharacterized membrane protein required for colicin V production